MLGTAVCGVTASQFLDVATHDFSRAFALSSALSAAGLLVAIWIWFKVPSERMSLIIYRAFPNRLRSHVALCCPLATHPYHMLTLYTYTRGFCSPFFENGSLFCARRTQASIRSPKARPAGKASRRDSRSLPSCRAPPIIWWPCWSCACPPLKSSRYDARGQSSVVVACYAILAASASFSISLSFL